ncbi:ParB N-terminal domain-containing protein [Burkholderia glumae]|uniref:ParB/RepB/Spo0J family partition protein n=1 Tax=Burkholderia glumae TaxID=337 RepID=UPI002036966B|nr:ParB N-terminal domain-containing protein [Burkholderia glumae]MCM2537964.1 ParB N-terminal domain-containing protein [Burkholderia glumae]
MAKNSIDAYGAKGKGNLLDFDPEDLTLVVDEAHPLYDSRVHLPLDEAMVRNIDFQGVLQPIEVTKNPETGDIEVVTGRQRVKNCREANRRRAERGEPKRLIKGFVRKLTLEERDRVLSAATASENAIRQQETPISRAEKMARQLAYRSEEDVAVIFGCNVQTVRASLSLLECCADVQKAVESGQISVTHAKVLAKLQPSEQRAKVKELIAAGDGVKGHAKARAQRAVMDGDAPRMRSRKTIEAELAASSGERAAALRWVLGQE